MADPATDALVASMILTTGASVYSASQASKAPKLPGANPDAPKAPTQDPAALQQQQADIEARTAGGTLLSNGKGPNVGDAGNSVRKTLLGT